MTPAEARALFYEAVQGSRLDMTEYDNHPARRAGWEQTIERESVNT